MSASVSVCTSAAPVRQGWFVAELWCLCHRLFHREGERPSDPDPPTGCWLVQGLYWHRESLAGCRFSGSLQADVTRPTEREREWRKDRNYFNDGRKSRQIRQPVLPEKKTKTISLCELWHYGFNSFMTRRRTQLSSPIICPLKSTRHQKVPEAF